MVKLIYVSKFRIGDRVKITNGGSVFFNRKATIMNFNDHEVIEDLEYRNALLVDDNLGDILYFRDDEIELIV